jgi:hypothetical protein
VPCVGKYTVCKDEPWFLFGTCLLWGTDLVCSESDLSVWTNEHENSKAVEESDHYQVFQEMKMKEKIYMWECETK